MTPKARLRCQAFFNSASTWQKCLQPPECARCLPAQRGGNLLPQAAFLSPCTVREHREIFSRKRSSLKGSRGEGYTGSPQSERIQPVMGWDRVGFTEEVALKPAQVGPSLTGGLGVRENGL